MSFPTAFFHDEKCLWHSTAGSFALILPVGGWVQPPAGAGLAESPESKRRMVSLMQVSGLASQVEFRSASAATEEDLLRVHPASYLERFKAMSDAGGGEIGDFAPFGRGSYEIAKQSAGLALHAVDTVLRGAHRNAYSMSRPPGHHCLADQPMGFCLLANIAIAVEAARARHGVQRVVVLDWDVHHGNGTQSIFYERDDVLTISLHQEGCYPPGCPDSFTYTIADADGQTATATVAMTIQATNRPPVANADSVELFGTYIPGGSATQPTGSIDPRWNDTDPDGSMLRITGVTQPLNGTASINAAGTTVTITRTAACPALTTTVGTVSYTISDGLGGTATGTITPVVTCENMSN